MSKKNDETYKPEEIWFEILSRKPKKIHDRFSNLSTSDQQAIINHLKKMISDDGWHKEQRHSAQIAIDVISKQKGK